MNSGVFRSVQTDFDYFIIGKFDKNIYYSDYCYLNCVEGIIMDLPWK